MFSTLAAPPSAHGSLVPPPPSPLPGLQNIQQASAVHCAAAASDTLCHLPQTCSKIIRILISLCHHILPKPSIILYETPASAPTENMFVPKKGCIV